MVGRSIRKHILKLNKTLRNECFASTINRNKINLDEFFRKPCSLGVHTAFDFVGLPVFEEFEIIAEENCGTPSEMILIRVVICDTEIMPEP